MAATREAHAAPFDAVLQQYLDVLRVEKNLSRFTLRNYQTDLAHLLEYLEAHGTPPAQLTRPVFRRYLASMIDAGTAQGSIVRRVSTARGLYRWLRVTGVMDTDPLANVALPKKPRRLPRALTLDDMTRIIDAADSVKPAGLRDRALLELLYGAGLRVSEAAALDLRHADLREMALLVHGKGNKERMVVIGVPARDALARYVGVRSKLADGPGEALFLNRDGGRLSQRRIQLIVRKYAMKAGLDARVHPHLFRHTFATHLLDGGAELRVVQELMGHASPNTTQVYLHVTEERQRAEMERSLRGIAQVESARRTRSR